MSNRILQIIVAITLLAVMGLYYLQFSQKEELVYVNSSKLINEYKGMLDARKVYQKKSTTWQANIDTLMSEVQSSIKKYEKDSRTMTDKERELSKQLLGTKQKQLVDYQKAIQEQARQEDQAMTTEVIKEINAYLKEYGEAHNYKIILAATDAGNIAYAVDSKDITESVLEGVNKKYTGE